MLWCVLDRGWVGAAEFHPGDRIQCMDNSWVTIDEIEQTNKVKPVYNLRVEVDHTYFVCSVDWGFAVWVHNI